jgi:hypothetical protein
MNISYVAAVTGRKMGSLYLAYGGFTVGSEAKDLCMCAVNYIGPSLRLIG